MTLAFEPLPCPESPLRRLDPRWKLAAVLPSVAVVAVLRGLPAVAVALAGALALAFLGRLPPRWFALRLGALAVFLAFFALPLPLLIDDTGPNWEVGPLRFSQEGLRLALLLGGKAAAILTLTLVLLTSAPLDATLKAAHALRVPGLLVQLAVLSYRYVFVASDELARLRTALRVRGYRNRANRHSYRTVGHVAGTLLVRSYERSERVGQAMRCRGFDGRFRSLAEFATRPADVLAFLLIAGGAAALLAWDVLRV
jgi:cobalt/nickel transport system permease protein